jgi:hypothetical protein
LEWQYWAFLAVMNKKTANQPYFLDFELYLAKIASPPDGWQMTDKLGYSSASRQVTLLANHLLAMLLPEHHLREPLFTCTVFADPILTLPGFDRGSSTVLACPKCRYFPV